MTDSTLQTEYREPSEHVAGRIVGIIVFIGGISFLVFAFALTYKAFHDPNLIVSLDDLRRTPPPSPTSIYVPVILKLILLFAMGYLASLIAARGAQLFFSARREEHRGHSGD